MAHTGHERQPKRSSRTQPKVEDKENFFDDSDEADAEPETDDDEAGDYFMMKTYTRRPPMPRSHWSESTIQTLDFTTPAAAPSVSAPPQSAPTPLRQSLVQLDAESAEDQSPSQPLDDLLAAYDDDEVQTPTPEEAQTPTSEEGQTPTPEREQRLGSLERQVRQSRYPNFSYKRNTVPRRPPMKTADSIDDFIKRGGWKRRGIVFQQDPERPLSGVDVDDGPGLQLD